MSILSVHIHKGAVAAVKRTAINFVELQLLTALPALDDHGSMTAYGWCICHAPVLKNGQIIKAAVLLVYRKLGVMFVFLMLLIPEPEIT